MATILILGGGTGGVVAANVLGKALNSDHYITLLDRNDRHIFYGAYPFLMVNKRKPEEITRKLTRLGKKGIHFSQTNVKGVTPEQKTVETDEGPFKYDYLIVSPGAELHPESMPGFAEGAYNAYDFTQLNDLRERLEEFRKGRITLFISSLPIKCPAGPYEMIFLLDEYFRDKKIREKVELTFVTPELYPLIPADPNAGESIRKMMKEREIGLVTEAKVLSLDPGVGKLNLDQGISLEGDLFIGIPPHRGPGVMRNSGLAEEGGWIEVDPHTMETRAKNVFAIGDATNIRLPVMNTMATKAGIFAHYQAEVVARNIACIIAGQKPRFRYQGKGA